MPTWRVALLAAVLLVPPPIRAESVPARHPEGTVHGFLVLHTLDGALLADGDLIQSVHGDNVTTRLTFHFRDGSIHDETALYSQRRTFRLLRAHLVQKGPVFPTQIDASLDGVTGDVAVRYTEKNEAERTVSQRVELPADVANGLILTLLKNIRADAARTTVSVVATAPKPRLVKLVIEPAGADPFAIAGRSRSAQHFVLSVEIGGVPGLLAPLLGKQPPATHVWILPGEAPAFVKSEGPLYVGGPAWRIELASPVWP